ncbi:MAG: DUF4396 domain-containing protein [Chloroflexia bacterium]
MIEGILLLWFLLTIPSALFVAWDLWRNTPEMGVMKPAWVLVTLYTGPVGLFIYLLSCKEPLPGTHEQFVAPQWKQAVGSTVHCVAGDALGIVIAAAVTGLLGLPMWVDLIVEYLAGFAVGLLIFQSLFMKEMMGLTYRQALVRTSLPEFLSMNSMAAGMFPTMVLLMSRDLRAMEPTSPYFWGAMSLGVLVGGMVAYPVNWWLVARGLKHGMGTQRVLGEGGHSLRIEGELVAKRTGEQPQPGGALAQVSAPPSMTMPM